MVAAPVTRMDRTATIVRSRLASGELTDSMRVMGPPDANNTHQRLNRGFIAAAGVAPP
jgi:hypothetical protein